MKPLPVTGTAGLLERLSPYIPDDLINSLCLRCSGPGRPDAFSAAQLFRVHLLSLLTPAHSFNLLVALLAEHRSWRSFARLRHRLQVPGVRQLHEFPQTFDPTRLRRINEHLLAPLIEGTTGFAKTVAVIDSTDLPAATNAYKKTPWANIVHAVPGMVAAAAKTVSAVISWATKNIRCAYGCANINRAFCWPR